MQMICGETSGDQTKIKQESNSHKKMILLSIQNLNILSS